MSQFVDVDAEESQTTEATEREGVDSESDGEAEQAEELANQMQHMPPDPISNCLFEVAKCSLRLEVVEKKIDWMVGAIDNLIDEARKARKRGRE